MTKRSVVLSLGFLIGLVLFMGQQSGGNGQNTDRSELAWRLFIDRIPNNTKLNDVCDLLKESSNLIGNMPLGGSGARTFYFEIDPVLWLEIDVDRSDIVLGARLAKAPRMWRRFPDGTVEAETQLWTFPSLDK